MQYTHKLFWALGLLESDILLPPTFLREVEMGWWIVSVEADLEDPNPLTLQWGGLLRSVVLWMPPWCVDWV